MEGREVVIVEAVRTPVGRGHPEKGYYKDVHPNELLGRTWTEVIDRAGIPAELVEDVITGCVQQYGEQSYNIGRNAWLQAGLPIETPATTIDRQCGSAQQAVNFAAALIASGVHDVAIGGGVEHMGHIPLSVNGKLHRGARLAVSAAAARTPRDRQPGAERGADRGAVGHLAERVRRDRAALASARRRRDGRGTLRARDRAAPGRRHDAGRRPGDPTRHDARGACRAAAGVQGGRPRDGRELVAGLRRRCGRPADVAGQGRRARSRPRGRGSSTRRPSASTRC